MKISELNQKPSPTSRDTLLVDNEASTKLFQQFLQSIDCIIDNKIGKQHSFQGIVNWNILTKKIVNDIEYSFNNIAFRLLNEIKIFKKFFVKLFLQLEICQILPQHKTAIA